MADEQEGGYVSLITYKQRGFLFLVDRVRVSLIPKPCAVSVPALTNVNANINKCNKRNHVKSRRVI